MDKVRIGIVGSKFAAGFHCDAYRRHPAAEVVAVAAIDNLEQIAREYAKQLRAARQELHVQKQEYMFLIDSTGRKKAELARRIEQMEKQAEFTSMSLRELKKQLGVQEYKRVQTKSYSEEKQTVN